MLYEPALSSFILPIIIGVVLYILSIIGIYKDSKGRNESTIFWVIFALWRNFSGILFPLMYLKKIVNPYNKNPKNTPILMHTLLYIQIAAYGIFWLLLAIIFFVSIGILGILLFLFINYIVYLFLDITVTIHQDINIRNVSSKEKLIWSIFAIFLPFITVVAYIFVVIKSKKYNNIAPVDDNLIVENGLIIKEDDDSYRSTPLNKVPTIFWAYIIISIISAIFSILVNISNTFNFY